MPDVKPTYLTRREVSQLYPISASTLARLASQGRGPAFYKPTDKALYRREDIEEWIQSAQVAKREDTADKAGDRPPGRGKARSAPFKRRVPADVVSAKTGRRLKSLTPSSDSYLRRPT